jgi:hypothetical protein
MCRLPGIGKALMLFGSLSILFDQLQSRNLAPSFAHRINRLRRRLSNAARRQPWENANRGQLAGVFSNHRAQGKGFTWRSRQTKIQLERVRKGRELPPASTKRLPFTSRAANPSVSWISWPRSPRGEQRTGSIGKIRASSPNKAVQNPAKRMPSHRP